VDAGAVLNLNDLVLFVQAVDSGGFSSASRRLNVPKSTISKRVAELELDLGVRLIHRTSRSFTLTDLGRDFYDHARAALIEAEAAESVVRRRQAEPSGVVRLTTSVPTAQYYLAERLPALAAAYPKLTLQLHVTDRFVDLMQEGFDIALRSHFAPLPDSGLMRLQVAVERIILVASPAYLATSAPLTEPADLAAHAGLLIDAAAKTWRLTDAAGREASVVPQARMMADETEVLLRAARAGLGVACLPQGPCEPPIMRGELVQVLPDWTAGAVTTSILTTHRRGQLPGVRAVVEFLARDLRC
jgi:DNA-binding transcriptional LysR family regulator